MLLHENMMKENPAVTSVCTRFDIPLLQYHAFAMMFNIPIFVREFYLFELCESSGSHVNFYCAIYSESCEFFNRLVLTNSHYGI